MREAVRRAHVDANVILRLLLGEPPEQAQAAKALFERAARGELVTVIHPAAFDEELSIGARRRNPDTTHAMSPPRSHHAPVPPIAAPPPDAPDERVQCGIGGPDSAQGGEPAGAGVVTVRSWLDGTSSPIPWCYAPCRGSVHLGGYDGSLVCRLGRAAKEVPSSAERESKIRWMPSTVGIAVTNPGDLQSPPSPSHRGTL